MSLKAEEAQSPPDHRPGPSSLAAALGIAAGNYELATATAIQAGLASFTNTPASETMSLINGSGAE